MTTQERHPETAPARDEVESATATTERHAGPAESSTAPTDRSTATTEPTAYAEPEIAGAHESADTAPAATDTAPAAAESETELSLFAEDQLAGLRARWDNVQAGFVDDPKGCVQTADGLVSDVVEQLTTGFTEARSRLEQRWSRGEEASTEDLRIALKRYRAFFERLLAV